MYDKPTKDRMQYCASVMTAAANGTDIQQKCKGQWVTVPTDQITWDWYRNDYRIRTNEFRIGEKFRIDGGYEPYMLSAVGHVDGKYLFALIGLHSGNRYTDPIPLSTAVLTDDDMLLLCSGQSCTKVSVTIQVS